MESPKEITDFEKELGYKLVANKLTFNFGTPSHVDRFVVRFENLKIKDGRRFVDRLGSGSTIDGALEDYCSKISNRFVIFGSSPNRVEIKLPTIVHTKLVEMQADLTIQ